MNDAQRLWWTQAKSDYAAFACLKRSGVHACHLLHYLQMATEKIGKAYLWRSNEPPSRRYVGFMLFLKAVRSRPRADLGRIATVFGFKRPRDMIAWVKQVGPRDHALQNLAPAEAKDGPNPEYPWPHEAPKDCPALHSFELWAWLQHHAQGRSLLRFAERTIDRFEEYA